MSKKLKRSAVALVLAATMVFSSQGVLTAFAAGGDIETEASVSSALEPILDNEETVVVEEPGNTDETETPEVTEPCGITEGCTLSKGHEGECQVAPVDPPAEGENGEGETQSCTKTEGCTLENGHEGECVTEPVTPPEEENGEDETHPCQKTEGCILPNGHEGECVVEENTEDTEDTQEPSEEDVAAAKNVSDLIGALPEASTLDPETTDVEALTAQVKAAREAYDKLTDAQKALVEKTVLDKLVALEGALEALQNTNVADVNAVAKIGDTTYDTLDEAITAAADGNTIEVLANCETEGMNLSKNLTIKGKGADSVNPEIKFTKYGIALWGKALTFQDCKVTMNGIGSTPYTAEWNWMTISASTNASLTLDNVEMSMDASGVANSPHAIYFCSNNVLNIKNGSVLKIKNYPQDALEWDGGDGGYNVNITDSTFISDHNRSGFTGTFWVTAENSTVEVINSTGNGSNGSHFKFIDCNESNGKYVNFSNNGSHGLSAGNLIITNSDVTANGNGICGVISSGEMNVTASTLTIEENKVACAQKSRWSRPGALVISGSASISSDSIVSIRKNEGSGIYLWGENATLNMQSGDIQENHSKIQGGGIYNEGQCTLSSDVQIFNNHAEIAGDDLYNSDIAWEYNSGTEDYDSVNVNSSLTFGKVGSDWKLDGAPDCNHTITGWFDDSKGSRWNVHTGPVHAELYNEFDETTGLTTITGLKALKAAHPYQYDPDAPTEPSEPVKWETSKSKTATNLDANYESQVTLSLPAKDEQLVSDVVFVLDKSTSTDVTNQINSMLEELSAQVEETTASVKVGIVSFNKAATRELELTDLTTGLEQIQQKLLSLTQDDGTNMHAGILAGKAMLDEDDTVSPNRKYLVFVTDGISYIYGEDSQIVPYYWLNDGSPYFSADPYSWNFKYGSNTPPDNWTAFLNTIGSIIPTETIKTVSYENKDILTASDGINASDLDQNSYTTTVDRSLYYTYEVYSEAQEAGYHCYAVNSETPADYPWGPDFMKYLAGGQEVSFEDIQNDIFYLLDAGSSVIDVIGGDDNGEQYDYDFDFVNDLSKITLTVNGVEKEGVPLGENHYGFGEKINYEGQEVYEYELTYYPNGLGVATMAFENEDVVAGELFVWDIYVPVKQFEPVQLTYTVKLANPKTADGTYGQYDEDGSKNYAGLYTNNSAVLFPVDSNGNVGEKEAFDKPTVSYTVSNGKPVEPTPDPDPDPDRPSRPNRDDDDDWEPLPDAPVKDKPTTEVDVPEETETPTTEQPDKYNPETGDTTTVFAAMALAAVSLGGVVLLGRKKK